MASQRPTSPHVAQQECVASHVLVNDSVNMSCSQPSPTGSGLRRARTKSLENLLELPIAKNPKLSTGLIGGVVPETSKKGDFVGFEKSLSPRCTNKQILEAIHNLSSKIAVRIDDVEQSLTQRIQHLENTLEDRLHTSLSAVVETRVQDAVAGMRVEVEEKIQSNLSGVEHLKSETTILKSDISNLKAENEYVTDMLLQHQKYLESCEATKRSSNIIITGVPETDLNTESASFTSDEEKVRCVLDEITQDFVEIQECVRLGKTASTRARPLKVILKNRQDRDSVLASSKLLKNKKPPLNKVYVKKDVHPMVRKEFSRLRRVQREEQEKAENQGKSVKYDAETRCVLVDGIVIDKFRPAFL